MFGSFYVILLTDKEMNILHHLFLINSLSLLKVAKNKTCMLQYAGF